MDIKGEIINRLDMDLRKLRFAKEDLYNQGFAKALIESKSLLANTMNIQEIKNLMNQNKLFNSLEEIDAIDLERSREYLGWKAGQNNVRQIVQTVINQEVR